MELNVFDNVPASGTATVSELALKANCEEEVISTPPSLFYYFLRLC